MQRIHFTVPGNPQTQKRFKVDVEDYDLTYEMGTRNFRQSEVLSECLHIGVAHSKARFDIDNQIKFVMDALAGVYWQNDGQVQIGWAYKIYSHKPRTELEIIYKEANHEQG